MQMLCKQLLLKETSSNLAFGNFLEISFPSICDLKLVESVDRGLIVPQISWNSMERVGFPFRSLSLHWPRDLQSHEDGAQSLALGS